MRAAKPASLAPRATTGKKLSPQEILYTIHLLLKSALADKIIRSHAAPRLCHHLHFYDMRHARILRSLGKTKEHLFKRGAPFKAAGKALTFPRSREEQRPSWSLRRCLLSLNSWNSLTGGRGGEGGGEGERDERMTRGREAVNKRRQTSCVPVKPQCMHGRRSTLTHSTTHPPTHPLTHPLTRSLSLSITLSLSLSLSLSHTHTHSSIHPLISSLVQQLARSLTHSLTNSLTHSLTPSPTLTLPSVRRPHSLVHLVRDVWRRGGGKRREDDEGEGGREDGEVD